MGTDTTTYYNCTTCGSKLLPRYICGKCDNDILKLSNTMLSKLEKIIAELKKEKQIYLDLSVDYKQQIDELKKEIMVLQNKNNWLQFAQD